MQNGLTMEHPEHASPIVRLSRLTTAMTEKGVGKGARLQSTRWTVRGVDAAGVERVYVEHASEDEHQAWQASDPLWHMAQSATIHCLLENPSTRDLVLQVSIKAAIDQGDLETAKRLFDGLSNAAKERLMAPYGDG